MLCAFNSHSREWPCWAPCPLGGHRPWANGRSFPTKLSFCPWCSFIERIGSKLLAGHWELSLVWPRDPHPIVALPVGPWGQGRPELSLSAPSIRLLGFLYRPQSPP